MGRYGYDDYYMYSGANDAGIWLIISAVLAIVGGIVLYFTFLKKSNDGKFSGFLGWMYDFLTFKKMLIENLLKVLYLIVAVFITLSSFAVIGESFLLFLVSIIGGNLVARIVYEFLLVALVMCRNTTDINDKLTVKANKEIKNDEN